MTPSLYNPTIDQDEGIVTFLLYNLSGQVIGYQHYRPSADKEKRNHPKEGRYYTYCTTEGDPEGPVNGRKCLAVWGMESFYFNSRYLFLTEGIFDACQLHNFNLPALALLSSDTKKVRSWLRLLGREIICICDDDEAGRKLAKYGHRAYYMTPDLGAQSESDIRAFLEREKFI